MLLGTGPTRSVVVPLYFFLPPLPPFPPLTTLCCSPCRGAMTGATCRASSRMARRSTALAVRWAAVAATLVVVGVVALTTAAAGAPPPSARAGVPAACVKTRTCACVYPPGAPADAPDAACTLRKCVTCPCARGGACTSALVLTQEGAEGGRGGAQAVMTERGGRSHHGSWRGGDTGSISGKRDCRGSPAAAAAAYHESCFIFLWRHFFRS